jgi:hypothetical protein
MIISTHGIIGSSIVSVDADAQAFITAANITDTTQQNAIKNLVSDLKSYGLWTKMKAIYPFVGGTAFSHKWNLKDPRDLDVAFRIIFAGGMNHSSNGIIPNGTTAYANTFVKPTNMGASSVHLSSYSKTNIADGYDMGSYLTTVLGFESKDIDGNSYVYTNTGGGNAYVGANDTRAFFIANRNSSTSSVLFRNTTKIINATKNVEIPNSINIYISALNFNGTAVGATSKVCAFSSIGDGLTDTEASNLYTAVQTYNATLNRQN